jgi:hypothetical protein
MTKYRFELVRTETKEEVIVTAFGGKALLEEIQKEGLDVPIANPHVNESGYTVRHSVRLVQVDEAG